MKFILGLLISFSSMANTAGVVLDELLPAGIYKGQFLGSECFVMVEKVNFPESDTLVTVINEDSDQSKLVKSNSSYSANLDKYEFTQIDRIIFDEFGENYQEKYLKVIGVDESRFSVTAGTLTSIEYDLRVDATECILKKINKYNKNKK